ncbi:DUF4251 domain-containing protein [Ulvibacterium sp.]|uniref:DUF4251 domain-containing protein n=1 Tax=Ulvibacterium sp. TaxID=2665914 RepID=UPI00261F2032|nr:DUF4251 domain-containing protein [Ulvibacterium sp.]
MKMKVLLILVFHIGCDVIFAQKQPQNSLDLVKSLLDSKHFVFEATRASPLGRPSISIVAIDNYVRIQKDSALGFLPYFGEMRLGIGYGEGGAIEFDSAIRDYRVKRKRSGKSIIVTFNTGNSDERFNFTLFITKSRSATVVVKSIHRNSITYYGQIRELDEDSLE